MAGGDRGIDKTSIDINESVRVSMRDVPTNGAGGTAQKPKTPSGVVPVVRRLMVRSRVEHQSRASAERRRRWRTHAQRREQTVERFARGQVSDSFADLPPHKAVVKHRELGHLFSIADPFYRCHDARAGSET